MKKITFFVGIMSLMTVSVFGQWKPADDKMKTKWADEIDPNRVLPEYPRPLMERSDWQNLNGLWDYAILPVGQTEPAKFDGKILVPFAVESSLSGVQKTVGEKNELWYRRTFTVPSAWRGRNILLHFGAVDWKAELFVNDMKIGEHTGGYTPFCFDVTPFLSSTGTQKLVVKVWDGTDTGFQPRGKQVNAPRGIWYTSVTGIWQTVWLEPVNEKYITNIKTLPDIDNNQLTVDVCAKNTQTGDVIEVKVKDGATTIASARASAGQTVKLNIPNAKLWSPESPFLYDMEVVFHSRGKIVDQVKSYCAMRKISTKRNANGVVRIQLNNRDYFNFGPLDQGWWPDGLYTAPTDEALKSDIIQTKEFGYNMIRKHVKVEPARWYTHCDRLGILVWQDMPNGENEDISLYWQRWNYFEGAELKRSLESEDNYRKEWKEIIDLLYSNPSVVVWAPFNEGWGQFKTVEIAEWTKKYDPSRLILPASGGNHFRTGDILSLHHYPNPLLFLVDHHRATVLGEYGGIGLPIEGHLWQPDRNWGYIQFKNSKEVTDEYIKYAERLKELIKAAFSAAVYTQTTDVEIEVNGLMTYDRKVVKMEVERIKKVNQEICSIFTDKFTIPVIPDTQCLVETNPEVFYAQTSWIAAKADSLRAPIVLHVGDIVNYDVGVEWERASTGMGLLDRANVGYAIAAGNHDTALSDGSIQPPDRNIKLRDTQRFNNYFPVSRFTMQQGRFEENKSDNAYYTFEAGGLKWLVIALEFCARESAAQWMDETLKKYPKHNAIILTHFHLDPNSTIAQRNDVYGDMNPSDIFNQYIKPNQNVLMVLSGHVYGSAQRTDNGTNGNLIYQILQDYQCGSDDHYIRLLDIDVQNKTITGKMYSPINGHTMDDQSNFTFSDVDFIK